MRYVYMNWAPYLETMALLSNSIPPYCKSVVYTTLYRSHRKNYLAGGQRRHLLLKETEERIIVCLRDQLSKSSRRVVMSADPS